MTADFELRNSSPKMNLRPTGTGAASSAALPTARGTALVKTFKLCPGDLDSPEFCTGRPSAWRPGRPGASMGSEPESLAGRAQWGRRARSPSRRNRMIQAQPDSSESGSTPAACYCYVASLSEIQVARHGHCPGAPWHGHRHDRLGPAWRLTRYYIWNLALYH
jgi:hypothetical protein